MGQLCIYLPPFASDYSGVCSALFDLHCLTAINDASCCTAHYVHYDEPRWNREVRPVLCTTLRNADAIFGSDEKVVARVCNAAERLDAPMIAIVGTPVPAIIGMDTVGIANEVEALSGRTAFGFDTTGFNWYDKGIVMAGRALIDRFATPPSTSPTHSIHQDKNRSPRVNILGVTPLDFGDTGTSEAMVSLLEENGIEVGTRFFMGLSVEQIEECGSADLNLAVSASGVVLAKYLEKRFNTPYLVGTPVGGPQTVAWLQALQEVLRCLRAKEATPDWASSGAWQHKNECSTSEKDGKILIVADQVIGNSVRHYLQLEGETRPIDVASFFTWQTTLAQAGDKHLPDEASYLQLLQSGVYSTLVADPLLLDVPHAEDLTKVPLVHPAVSGKLHWDEAPNFFGECHPLHPFSNRF